METTKKDKIYLNFNNACTNERCTISGEPFSPGIPLAFFLNNDFGLPVMEGIAIERGFTIDSEVFLQVNRLILCGIGHSKEEDERDNDLSF